LCNETLAQLQTATDEATSLQDQVANLRAELESAEAKRADSEKEQEDLLVLLEELSSKRRRDKARLKAAGEEVSEEEEEEDEGEGDEAG
jgi:chromosome segregation ATPase